MKRLIKFLALAMILIIASCSAEIVNNLDKEEIDEADNVQAYTRYDGEQLEIFFEPNAFARSYGYKIGNDPISSVPYLNATGDWYTFALPLTELKSNSGEITIYGKTRGSEDWKKTSSTDYVISPNDIAPEAYLSRRNENSVEIYLNSFFSPTDYKLEITTKSTGETKTVEVSDRDNPNNIATINGLIPTEEYIITVSHKNGGSYTERTIEINIPTYSSEASINLKLTDNGFTIENAGGNAELWKKDSASSSFAGTKVADITSNTIEFSKLKSLESGYFYVKSGETISNIVKATTPLTLVSDPIVNYKSVVLEFDFAEDATNLAFRVLNGATGSTVRVKGNRVIIEGLNSNTTFENLELDVINAKYSTVGNLLLNKIETKSFAGETEDGETYEWQGTLIKGTMGNKPSPLNTNFCIRVIEAPDQSTYPYYIYFTKEDDAITNKESYDDNPLRIMPLIDVNVDADLSLDTTVDCNSPQEGYKDANSAYMTNAAKWNSTDYPTVNWKIVSKTPLNKEDHVTTRTSSTAIALGMTMSNQITVSEFYFMEFDIDDDGHTEPVIKFKNTGEGLVSFGVYSNGSNDSDIYAKADINETQKQYCWYLTTNI